MALLHEWLTMAPTLKTRKALGHPHPNLEFVQRLARRPRSQRCLTLGSFRPGRLVIGSRINEDSIFSIVHLQTAKNCGHAAMLFPRKKHDDLYGSRGIAG